MKNLDKIGVGQELPLGTQQLPVMIGRMKDTKNVIIQTDGKYVEIKKEHVKDTALALLAMVQV